MNIQVKSSSLLKPVSTYQFDYGAAPFRIERPIKAECGAKKFLLPTVNLSCKEMIDMTYTTTSQRLFPLIRNTYRLKPNEGTSTPVNCVLTNSQTSHREKLDTPEIVHWSDSNNAKTESKVELGRNGRGSPSKWSRLPQQGCKAPSTKPACNAVRPPTKCDCPSSCCSRTVCRGDAAVCICGIPCTEPTGRPLICDACLCYVFPGNPKAFSTKHFCPRTQTDAPQCPECKSVLPNDPMVKKRLNYFPVQFNVPKTPAPIFRKITKV